MILSGNLSQLPVALQTPARHKAHQPCKSTGWSQKHWDQLIPKQNRGKDPSLWRSSCKAPPAPKPILVPQGSGVPIPPWQDLTSHLSHPIPALPGASTLWKWILHGISEPLSTARRIPKGGNSPQASHSRSTAKFQSSHLPFPRRKAKFIPCLQLLRFQGNESWPGSCAGHSNISPKK